MGMCISKEEGRSILPSVEVTQSHSYQSIPMPVYTPHEKFDHTTLRIKIPTNIDQTGWERAGRTPWESSPRPAEVKRPNRPKMFTRIPAPPKSV